MWFCNAMIYDGIVWTCHWIDIVYSSVNQSTAYQLGMACDSFILSLKITFLAEAW